ncbi:MULTISPECIES: cupin domain-containing protein [Marinomonas]|uniref:cupin domain-containing protein n=1 Tax=Marinomonas TaxID=28253 RepID=UPI001A9ED999|nr:cupin domain-containing protein [Marinomonas sp. KMM3893]
MTKQTLESRVVRYGELVPCKTAFIDTHTPGSDQKENFTIIGAGVSESPDQHVHIRDTPGFNIGAAGQPPKCTNSLHTHRTAEVFFVQKGTWRFFWGIDGTDGEFIAKEGDLFNIPTGIFRGFENVGEEYGMIMAVLGGNDAGGGVIWAPQVIQTAKQHGLILAETGRLYDTKKGESLPVGVNPMPILTNEELAAFPVVNERDVIPHYVARYLDIKAMGNKETVQVLGAHGILKDRPGFEIDFLQAGQKGLGERYRSDQHEVFMVHEGHWKIWVDDESAILAPGDTCAVPPNVERSIQPNVSGSTGLFLIRSTNDEAGYTQSV